MATITGIKSGLKTRLDTIDGLTGYSYVPGHFTLPAAVPFLDEIDWDEAMGRGLDALRFTVRLYVATLDHVDENAQTALHGYLAASGSGSVKAAIEGDTTLGGVVDTCRVTLARGDLMLEHANNRYLGAEFEVQVWG